MWNICRKCWFSWTVAWHRPKKKWWSSRNWNELLSALLYWWYNCCGPYMVKEDRKDSTALHCHLLCRSFSRSCWVHQGQTSSRLCPHSDVQRDSRQLMALSGVYLTAIWCDSSHPRVLVCSVVFIQTGTTFITEDSIHLLGGWWCGWLSIAGSPSNSTLSIFKHN